VPTNILEQSNPEHAPDMTSFNIASCASILSHYNDSEASINNDSESENVSFNGAELVNSIASSMCNQ